MTFTYSQHITNSSIPPVVFIIIWKPKRTFGFLRSLAFCAHYSLWDALLSIVLSAKNQ